MTNMNAFDARTRKQTAFTKIRTNATSWTQERVRVHIVHENMSACLRKRFAACYAERLVTSAHAYLRAYADATCRRGYFERVVATMLAESMPDTLMRRRVVALFTMPPDCRQEGRRRRHGSPYAGSCPRRE